MRRLLPALAFAACLVMLAGVAWAVTVPAVPYVEPADCYQCHVAGGAAGSKPVDFTVGSVDMNACKACHGAIPLWGYEDHFHGGFSTCSGWSGCHGWPYYQEPDFDAPVGEVIEPLVTTTYGKFQSAASPEAGVVAVHAAHAGTGWIQTEFANRYPEYLCQNCHSAAGCAVCHTGTVAHGSHGANSCQSAGCHTYSATSGITVPACLSCHPTMSEQTHGTGHVATDGTTGGVACSACHDLDLVTEHAKGSSTSSEASCAACHPAPATSTAPEWTGTCVTADCHSATATSPGVHVSLHAVTAPAAGCLNCHSFNLVTEHAARGYDCFACHSGSYDAVLASWDHTCDACHQRHSDRGYPRR